MATKFTHEEAVEIVQSRFPDAEPIDIYVSSGSPWLWRCPIGHESLIRLSHIQQGRGICSRCSDKKKFTHEEAVEIIKVLFPGAEPVGRYVNVDTPWAWLCPEGHEAKPRLKSIREGQGMCASCGGNKPLTHDEAVERIRARFPTAEPLEEFTNTKATWHWICPNGHLCTPKIDNVGRGQGMCRTCAGQDPITEEQAQIEILSRFPEAVQVGEFIDSQQPWHWICPAGHDCYPRLSGVKSGRGICYKCSGRSPYTHEDAVALVLAKFPDAIPIGRYSSVGIPWHWICPAGHDCYPRLGTIMIGANICWKCAGNAPHTHDEAVEIVKSAFPGAEPVGEYVNVNTAWKWICPEGHETSPKLTNIVSGQGLCASCAETGFNPSKKGYLYVIQDVIHGRTVVQFGITNVPANRLKQHKVSGFTKEPLILKEYEIGSDAFRMERSLINLMKEFEIPTAKERGYHFSGYTEAFLLGDAQEDFLSEFFLYIEGLE